MNLFNKKFVYFMWDDELEGKEGIFADTISSLITRVNDNSASILTRGTVTKGDNLESPFLLSGKGIYYKFFYYDPLYNIKLALKNGKKLQWKGDDIEDWEDFNLEEIEDGFEYRIKPQELMTYRQLAQWLAEGNGQYRDVDCSLIKTIIPYDISAERKEVTCVHIRYWGSDKWIEPTVDVYYKDCNYIKRGLPDVYYKDFNYIKRGLPDE